MVKRVSTLEKSWLSCQHWLPLSLTDSLTPSLIYLQFVICDLAMFIFMLFITLSRIMEEAPTSSSAVEMQSTATSPIASTSGWQVLHPDPDDGGDDDDHDDGAECNIRI